ncbi:ParB/RepB/Spo0J family partition protein [Clostridium botulinum]|uniref:Plasmid stablization protein ParB n=1 Tax=Clostridium botulinum C/D str. DC5 TaxID=1443128 RepID=A0A0A0IDM9_CLOBO|nr:ParB/RepB/Spo0J family partition protein [Clostridium botulinum]KEI01989.1 plasmid stablization protein ParB [Clostridium botulinum C/D str. BKT75002]KEI10091.1 plasmid stablization protein ParB [Clostridium botulinum C/D str. BKT2873]KGM98259.1 plasmid stablization protein ParB [Clostridium botulinum D str. CCUG 7971]KGM98613.1 plasmid stablization protein ParB [Clostridium botulinum C/D str. DC5]KOC50469.1 chromosome partitioning protein ParB [Clostridium botulinum]
MSKKFGLGKGLGALIPEENTESSESVLKIKMNLIKPNSNQPRKSFDEEKILQLAESIKEHGVIQPLILQKTNELYTIIAGERRWRAAKKVGLQEVPAVIVELSNKEILEVSLIENIQREDLNPIEEALAYKKLIDEFNLTQDALGKRIGKSRTAITNCMRLLNLGSRTQEYLIDGVISEGHGRVLLSIEDEELQYKIAQEIIDKQLSVRQTEILIKNIKKGVKEKQEEKLDNINPYYKDITNKLQNLFNTKVVLSSKGNRGKIQIEYYSEEDLQRIIDVLKI